MNFRNSRIPLVHPDFALLILPLALLFCCSGWGAGKGLCQDAAPQHRHAARAVGAAPTNNTKARRASCQEGRERLPAGPRMLTGLDVLELGNFAALRGRRIGLITNQSGRTRDGRSGIDVLWRAARASGAATTANGAGGANNSGAAGADAARIQQAFTLVALFSPEHGLRGRAKAGASVNSSRDSITGLPIHSLYGKTLKPTSAMLRNIDTLVFDIQDIGSRSYTYISTLGLCMEAAAAQHIRFVVLDRPDPLGGEIVEGNIPAAAYRSFVGRYPVPYLHGLTVGELARLLNGQRLLAGGVTCDLAVVPLQGWRRGMMWDDTGLTWTPTSPNVPYARTALYYAATGIVGELPALSIGIGTARPFEVAGAPGLDANAYVRELTRRSLPGVTFTPDAWTPAHGVYAGRQCTGVRITITDATQCELTRLNFELMNAARVVKPALGFFHDAETTRMFDLVNGSDGPRRLFASGAAQMWQAWNTAPAAFRVRRKPYLLYP